MVYLSTAFVRSAKFWNRIVLDAFPCPIQPDGSELVGPHIILKSIWKSEGTIQRFCEEHGLVEASALEATWLRELATEKLVTPGTMLFVLNLISHYTLIASKTSLQHCSMFPFDVVETLASFTRLCCVGVRHVRFVQ